MNIHLSRSTGTGPTELSAFDAALYDAGIANRNLLRLSSVIPPETTIITHTQGVPVELIPGEWGDRLYVVMAEMRASTPHTEAWAGVGWVQDKATGRGLFVEHEGNSEQLVRDSITHSLEALMATRNIDFGDIHMEVIGTTCTHLPVCAMVVAVYQASDWDNKPHFAASGKE